MTIYVSRNDGTEVKVTSGTVAVSGTVGQHSAHQLAAIARAACPGERLTLVGAPYVWPATESLAPGEPQYVTRTYTRAPRPPFTHPGLCGIAPVVGGALTCGTCGTSWDDDITPAGRCPWEYDHSR